MDRQLGFEKKRIQIGQAASRERGAGVSKMGGDLLFLAQRQGGRK